jgi:hypothetical protein
MSETDIRGFGDPAMIAVLSFMCCMRNARRVIRGVEIGWGEVLSDEQVEPDRLERPRLGGSGRFLAAMVLGRRIEAMSPRHREWLQPRSVPGARYYHRAACRRCADEGEARLGGDCGRISAPENCAPKVPLPIRCQAAFFHCDGAKNSAVERYTNRSS